MDSPSKCKKKRRSGGKDKTQAQLPKDLDCEQIKQFDELLEDATDKFNISRRVSKAIVRNIIASEESKTLLKVAAGIAHPSELPAQKFTRSKTKLNVPLRPVEDSVFGGRPPNFLHVEDFGNDEDDVDFILEEDDFASSKSSTDSSSGEDNEEEALQEAANELHGLADDHDDFFDSLPGCHWMTGQDINLNSVAIHDPLADTNQELYPEWLLKDYNEMEEIDPDYNYEAEAEAEDDEDENEKLESYNQRTVMSKRELKVLMADAFDLEQVPVAVEKRRLREEFRQKIRSKKDSREIKTAPMPDDGSCSLLRGGPLLFQKCEVDQLVIQLEQHLQMLTQTIALCFHDRRCRQYNVVSRCQQMFNELNDYDVAMREKEKASLFNISNMEEAIVTLHDIHRIPEVPDLLVNWQNAPAPTGFFPRPEACLALSRSKALLYPSLIPYVQPHGRPMSSKWTPIEETLLFLGLIQFGYFVNSSKYANEGRYYQIQQNLLPTRTTEQICEHLANLRKAPIANPFQKMVLDAESDNPMVKFENDFARQLCTFPMFQWPQELKPCWFDSFVKLFHVSGDIITYTGGKTYPAPQAALSYPSTVAPNESALSFPGNVTLLCQGDDGVARPIQLNLDGQRLIILSPGHQPIPPVPSQPAAPIHSVEATTDAVAQPPCISTPNVPMEVESEPLPCGGPPETDPLHQGPSSPEESGQDTFVDIESLSDVESRPFGITAFTPRKQSESETESQSAEKANSETVQETPSRLNKRKLFKPVKFVTPVRKRRLPARPKEVISRAKEMDQIREQLSLSSSESEASNSPQKKPIPRKSIKEANQSDLKKKTKKIVLEDQFEFQDTSRDMPLLVPLEVSVECSNSFIPRTPGAHTPSDCSNTSHTFDDVESPPKRAYSRLSLPKTPRDDNVTQSPTLLRVDTLMARSLLSKVKVTTRKNLFSGPTDFSILAQSPTVEEKVQSFMENSLPCESDSEPSSFSHNCEPSTSHSDPENDRDLPTDTLPRKWKKRTRHEKAQDGLEGMNDPEYRRKQEQILCRHIFSDIKKRLLLRRDLYNRVQAVFERTEDPTEIMRDVRSILGAEFPEVVGLVACLFPEDNIPRDVPENSARKAYREALDMIMAIDAYAMRTKYKRSKSSKLLFKLVSAFCSQDISSEEFCGRMKELFRDAPPLWKFLKERLPVEFDENVEDCQVELLDLTSESPGCVQEEHLDVNRLLKPVPSKRRNKVHIHNGHLYVHTGVSYVMAEIEKAPKFATPVGRAPQSKVAPRVAKKASPIKKVEPKWTKEYDLKILGVYNMVEEDDENAVIEVLLQSLPFSREKIAERLNFLLAQFTT